MVRCDTQVNGQDVLDTCRLNHDDVLVLGFANFRFVDPRLNASPLGTARRTGSMDENDRSHPGFAARGSAPCARGAALPPRWP